MKLRLKYNHWYPKLIGVGAITIYPFILVAHKKEVFDEKLLNHEMEHIHQVRAEGWFKFYASYLASWSGSIIRGKDWSSSYHDIPYEIEAYDQGSKLSDDEKEELGLLKKKES